MQRNGERKRVAKNKKKSRKKERNGTDVTGERKRKSSRERK